MKTYIKQSQLDKRLCIHWQHHEAYFDGLKLSHWCNKYAQSSVNDHPMMKCEVARVTSTLCGSKLWEFESNIVPASNEAEADGMNKEEGIESYMNTARRIVDGGLSQHFTCGLLGIAIVRVGALELEELLKLSDQHDAKHA